MRSAAPHSCLGLGELELVEVFDYYDGPVLFTARMQAGQLLLGIYADVGPTHDSWLYLPVGRGRIDALRAHEIDLRTAFQQPEDGFVHLVRTGDSGSVDWSILEAGEIPTDWLPPPREMLVDVAQVTDEVQLLIQPGEPLDDVDGDMFAKLVPEVLNLVQATADAELTGRAWSERPHDRAVELRKSTRVAHTIQASFGLRLLIPREPPSAQPDAFETRSLSQRVVERLDGALQLLLTAWETNDVETVTSDAEHLVTAGISKQLAAILDSSADHDVSLRVRVSGEAEGVLARPKRPLRRGGGDLLAKVATSLQPVPPEPQPRGLVGYVEQLSRKNVVRDEYGEEVSADRQVVIVVSGGQGSRELRYRVELDAEQYEVAIEAHEMSSDVYVRGVPTERGNFRYLERLTHFQIAVFQGTLLE